MAVSIVVGLYGMWRILKRQQGTGEGDSWPVLFICGAVIACVTFTLFAVSHANW